ncbi:PKD domain-containing protein [Aureispira anguillae]|uniref:PKD domain-containing protein n=1 Tax=Aureispira anguillae TaxID=2864201 RepID=A0A915YEX8_9BACT|nr:PKD domain-containing protein [Aureispira anguillae]BDS11882.1 PKD domain-containing protein [Aureispira anguillae]
MKYLFTILFSCCLLELAYTQIVNRYPNIQRPSQTTATIAWRRANASTGTLYLGTAPNVWFDSVTTVGLAQKHFFDLAGLQANTQYYYQVKSIAPNDTFVSAIEHFETAPLPLEDKVSFLAYGDCGYNNTMQNQVGGLMEQEAVDFALVTGDIDQNIGDNYDGIFFGVYKDMLKQNCHFTCIGNHDTYADNAATYLDAFYLFSNNPANTERYYSFEWGDAKFVCLDANLDYTIGSAQHNWMLDEFKCNDKKWLFIFFHQPPWTNAWSLDYYVPFSPYFLYQGDEDMRTDLVPEFEKYGVDFVVNGHSHCYQRGAMNGVQYLVTGGAGASTLDANTNSNAPNLSVEIYENHYIRFDINGDTAKYVMINNNGQRRDSVVVIKPYLHYSQNISSSNASCNGANDGQAILTVSGPKPPYTFLWDNGQTSANLTGLAPGTYHVAIIDSVGCERTDSVVITEPTALTTQITTATGDYIICDSTPLSLSAIGNFTNYTWSTADTTSTIQVVSPNVYTVTAYDALGCASAPYSITVTAETSPNNTTFLHNSTGLNASFTTANTGNYLWDFGDNTTSTLQHPNHNYSTAGVYTVQLVVSNACGSDTSSQLVTIVGTNTTTIETLQALELSLTPNPFSEFTILSFNNPTQETFSLSITDVQGKILRNYTNITGNQIQIDKKELSAGTYLYTLKSDAISVSGKLLIQ